MCPRAPMNQRPRHHMPGEPAGGSDNNPQMSAALRRSELFRSSGWRLPSPTRPSSPQRRGRIIGGRTRGHHRMSLPTWSRRSPSPWGEGRGEGDRDIRTAWIGLHRDVNETRMVCMKNSSKCTPIGDGATRRPGLFSGPGNAGLRARNHGGPAISELETELEH